MWKTIGICWLTGAPAPDVVLALMSCKCARHCDEDCLCVVNGLRCTPACKFRDCANTQEDDEVGQYSDNSDGDTQ